MMSKTRLFSVVLVAFVALVLIKGVNPVQAAPSVERINSWVVTDVSINLTSCNFPEMYLTVPDVIWIRSTLNITWADYQSDPSNETILVTLYDGLGRKFLYLQEDIMDPSISDGAPRSGGTYDTPLSLGFNPTSHDFFPSRPWRMVATEISGYGEEVGSVIFDPADFGVCLDSPYVGIQNISDQPDVSPIIDTSSQNTAVYNNLDSDGNPSLDVYGIDENGNGYYVFTITEADLASYVDNPPNENEEITSVGNFALYALTTGEYQLNIGADAEGKVRVIIFDGLPPTNVYSYTYNVYDILAPDE